MNGLSRGLVVTKDNIIVRSDGSYGGTNPGIYCIKKDASGTVWHVPSTGAPNSYSYGFFDSNFWYGNAAITHSSSTVNGLCKIKASTGVVQWATSSITNARELCFLSDRVVCFSGDTKLPSITSFSYTTGAIIATKEYNEIIPSYSVLGSMGIATEDDRLFVVAYNGDPPEPGALVIDSALLICMNKNLEVVWSVELKTEKDAVTISPRVRILKNKVWLSGASINMTQNDYSTITYTNPDPPPALSYQIAYGFIADSPSVFPPPSPAGYFLGGTNLDQTATTGPLYWCPVAPYTKVVRGLVGSQGWVRSFDKNTGVVLNNISTGNFTVLPGSMPGSKETAKIPQYMFPGKEFFGLLFWNSQCTEPALYKPGYLSSNGFASFPWHNIEIKTYDYNGNALDSFNLGASYPNPSTNDGSGPITNRIVNGIYSPINMFHVVANGAGSNGILLFIKDLINPNICNLHKLTANSLTTVGLVSANLNWQGSQWEAADRDFQYPDIVVSDNHVYYIDSSNNLQRLGLSL